MSPSTISIRPDNSRAAEECFPLALSAFSVRDTSTVGRAGGAGALPWFSPRRPPPDTTIVLTVNVGSAPRTIMLAPIVNPRGNAPRVRDLLQLCNRRVATAKGMLIAAPRDRAPDVGDGDALMGDDGAVAPGPAAPADVNPPPASEHTNALTTLTSSFARSSTNPRVVVLGDPTHSEAFGTATQSAASDMNVTTVRFSDTPYDGMVSIYLAALAQQPVEVEELIVFAPSAILMRIAALPSARRADLDRINADIHDLATGLSEAVALVRPLSDTRGGDEPAHGTRTVSLYVWTARESDSALG